MKKVILIAPKDQFCEYYAVCEYDDYLLCAHLTADVFSKKIKCKITDLRYCIVEKIGQFSMMSNGSKSEYLGDDFLLSINIKIIENDCEWHDFEQIDTDEYAKIICNGQPDASAEPF